jgi:hypothetical protein
MTEVQETKEEVTLESLAKRMDMFGAQMNWLCENMQGLFQFVTQVGQSGGGIRGLMSAMKNGAPQLSSDSHTGEGKEVVSND